MGPVKGIRNRESGISEESGIRWWAVEELARWLDRDERDAVYGDLIESHAPASRALLDVGGLVLRRQAAAWLDWHPWFILATVVVPLGFLLSVSSRGVTDAASHYMSLYSRTGEWAYLAIPGWRRDAISAVTQTSLSLLALIGWSWTTGFALGRLSRRAALTIALLFCANVVASTLGSTSTVRLTPHGVQTIDDSAVMLVLRVLLVFLPAWRGFTRSLRPAALGRRWTIGIALAVIALTAATSHALEGSLIFGYHVMLPPPGPDHIVGTADDPRPFWWVSLVMIWPAGFMLRTMRRRAVRGG